MALEIVSDGDGLAVIGAKAEVDRFLLTAGLDKAPARDLDLHRLWSAAGTGGTAMKVAADIAENSGRWVKLTKESAAAMKKAGGLMPTKTPGVSHAMIGNPGDIKQWLQISSAPTALLGGPLALTSLSTMMQQRAMQQQMDEMVEYLQSIDQKVDDILRSQKDAVLADMIGVDLIIEEALIVSEQVGHVSEVTWSKVQATSLVLARTQAYAIRQLDAIAEKLEGKADPGEVAKATKQAEPQVREWLAVIARTIQLLDGAAIVELDRVARTAIEDLESHRIGLKAAHENRLQVIGRATARLLIQMDEAVTRANSKVLFNPFDSPAAVKSSTRVASEVNDFQSRLAIGSGHASSDARRWIQAASEARDKVVRSAVDGAAVARRVGGEAVDRAADPFRKVDIDGDGIVDQSRAGAAVESAGSAVKGVAENVAGALGSALSRRKSKKAADVQPEAIGEVD